MFRIFFSRLSTALLTCDSHIYVIRGLTSVLTSDISLRLAIGSIVSLPMAAILFPLKGELLILWKPGPIVDILFYGEEVPRDIGGGMADGPINSAVEGVTIIMI